MAGAARQAANNIPPGPAIGKLVSGRFESCDAVTLMFPVQLCREGRREKKE